MIINRNLFPVHSIGISTSVEDGQMILYLCDSEQALLLNQASAVIWEICDGKTSVNDVINVLSDAFPESKDQIEADVIKTLESFQATHVISIQEAAI